MGSQSFHQAESSVVDQDYDHANRRNMPVINQGINYRWVRGSNKICSLTNMFLSALVLLSLMSFSPVMSLPLPTQLRLDVNLTKQFARATKDTLYDCHIDALRETQCVLQSFRDRRFADETAVPVNINIPNLPTAMNIEDVSTLPLAELVPKLHRELIIFGEAFYFMKENERNLPEGSHFITEFSDVWRKITAMHPLIENYMDHHGYALLTHDLVPGFEDTDDSSFFSPRSLYVLEQFKPFLTRFLQAVDRF